MWSEELASGVDHHDLPKRTKAAGKVTWRTRPDLPKGAGRYGFQLRFTGNDSTKPTRSSVFRLPSR